MLPYNNIVLYTIGVFGAEAEVLAPWESPSSGSSRLPGLLDLTKAEQLRIRVKRRRFVMWCEK